MRVETLDTARIALLSSCEGTGWESGVPSGVSPSSSSVGGEQGGVANSSTKRGGEGRGGEGRGGEGRGGEGREANCLKISLVVFLKV